MLIPKNYNYTTYKVNFLILMHTLNLDLIRLYFFNRSFNEFLLIVYFIFKTILHIQIILQAPTRKVRT